MNRLSWMLCLFFVGCDNLRSVKETIPIPRVESPYAAAFLCPQVPEVRVVIRKITPALGEGFESDQETVLDAVVQLIDQDGKVLAVTNNGRGDYRVAHRGFVQAGRRYRLLITTPRGDRLESACTIPLTNVDPAQVRAEESEQQYRFVVSWADPSAAQNYYALTNYSLSAYKDTTLHQAIGGQQIFSDQMVSVDRRLTATGLGTSDFTDDARLTRPNVFYIAHTDSAYYYYHKSLEDAEVARQNPFAEPVNMYSNMKGGYGILSGFVRQGFRYDGKRLTTYP